MSERSGWRDSAHRWPSLPPVMLVVSSSSQQAGRRGRSQGQAQGLGDSCCLCQKGCNCSHHLKHPIACSFLFPIELSLDGGKDSDTCCTCGTHLPTQDHYFEVTFIYLHSTAVYICCMLNNNQKVLMYCCNISIIHTKIPMCSLYMYTLYKSIYGIQNVKVL